MIVGSTGITGKLQLEASRFSASLSPVHVGQFVQNDTMHTNYTRKFKLIKYTLSCLTILKQIWIINWIMQVIF